MYPGALAAGTLPQYNTITPTDTLITFKETVAVYCENYTNYVNAFCAKTQSFSTLQQMLLVMAIFRSLVSFAYQSI